MLSLKGQGRRLIRSFFLLIAIVLPTTSLAETWACQPAHWVNLRADGPLLNEGLEPIFVLELSTTNIITSGENSWLNKGEFGITERLEFGTDVYFYGSSSFGSQIAFSPTKKLFFHSSTSAGISVSMTGTCNRIH